MKRRVCILAIAMLLMPRLDLHAQQSDNLGVETATADRISSKRWWPTKADMLPEAFAKPGTCSRCHSEEATFQPSTGMGRAAMRANQADLFSKSPSLTYLSPPFKYAIQSNASETGYSVSDGTKSLSTTLKWIMGAGDLGQTFLYQIDNRWYESQVSFYTHGAELDLTTGHAANPIAVLTSALGQSLDADEAQRCFGCHTTGSSTVHGFTPASAEPGLGCEACHGPGQRHVAALTDPVKVREDGSPSKVRLSETIFDPAKLSPVDSVDFCGACHRTWADVALAPNQSRGVSVVRFQPYRLEKSKCWGENGDERITCVACHDPHQPLNRDDLSYDKQCLACHSPTATSGSVAHSTAKTCPKAVRDCVSCHMPKVDVASMHGAFTDHFIRVVSAGGAFPQ